MSIRNYYVAKLNSGCSVLGTLKSIKRIAAGTKRLIVDKALSRSNEGEEMFNCAKNPKKLIAA